MAKWIANSQGMQETLVNSEKKKKIVILGGNKLLSANILGIASRRMEHVKEKCGGHRVEWV